MTNFAYLRVSTDNQDVKNQKFGVLDYILFVTESCVFTTNLFYN